MLCETPVGCKISKNRRGPFGNIEKIEKKLKLKFSNSVTVPKIVKGGTLWGFFDIHCAAKYFKKIEGEALWWNPKSLKKSRIVPKKIRVKNTKGGSYVIEVLDVDVFVLDEVLAGRVCFGGFRTVVKVDDVEQMNKKWTDRVELTKKTSHCKILYFLRKRRLKR